MALAARAAAAFVYVADPGPSMLDNLDGDCKGQLPWLPSREGGARTKSVPIAGAVMCKLDQGDVRVLDLQNQLPAWVEKRGLVLELLDSTISNVEETPCAVMRETLLRCARKDCSDVVYNWTVRIGTDLKSMYVTQFEKQSQRTPPRRAKRKWDTSSRPALGRLQ